MTMENNEKVNVVDVPVRCKRLLDYLRNNCNGKEHIKTFDEIMLDFKPIVKSIEGDDYAYTHGRFKKDVQIIRRSFNTFICSTCKGYYVPYDEGEMSNYLTSQAITHIKTCIAQGVNPSIFYDVLNNTKCNNVQDGQGKLKISPYASEEVSRYASRDE